MGPSDLWATYIKPMGAGAVAAAGLITLIKTIPTIWNALTAGFSTMRPGTAAAQAKPIRTENDLSMSVVLIGSLLIVVCMFIFLEFKPVPGAFVGWAANLAASLLVVVFGFLFVTVSSRIVGLVGSSASPVSGMTIATLMATAAIFLVQGWTAPAFGALAITIGGVVCIAASNSGDTSQDLKTGYIVGSTPRLQQIALMIGVVVSTLVIGFTLNLMNIGLQEFHAASQPWDINAAHSGVSDPIRRQGPAQPDSRHRPRRQIDNNAPEIRVPYYSTPSAQPNSQDGKYLYSPATGRIEVHWIQGIGSASAPAPQARLMATVINGILSRKLPWGLVLLGVSLVIAVELLGIRSLPFAVGAYLPIGTTLPIFCGGVVRWLVDAAAKRAGESSRERRHLTRLALRFRTHRRRRHRRTHRRRTQGRRSHILRQPRPAECAAHLPRQQLRLGPRLRRAGIFALLLREEAAEEVTPNASGPALCGGSCLARKVGILRRPSGSGTGPLQY